MPFVKHDGHLTTGQRAMAVAMIYPEEDERGRGKQSEGAKIAESGGFSTQRIREARTVLHHTTDNGALVLSGASAAYESAQKAKRGPVCRAQNADPKLANLVVEGPLTLEQAEATAQFIEFIRTQGELYKKQHHDPIDEVIEALEICSKFAGVVLAEIRKGELPHDEED